MLHFIHRPYRSPRFRVHIILPPILLAMMLLPSGRNIYHFNGRLCRKHWVLWHRAIGNRSQILFMPPALFHSMIYHPMQLSNIFARAREHRFHRFIFLAQFCDSQEQCGFLRLPSFHFSHRILEKCWAMEAKEKRQKWRGGMRSLSTFTFITLPLRSEQDSLKKKCPRFAPSCRRYWRPIWVQSFALSMNRSSN